jgi:crotonobetainyl-CoA:carnitine CoA-transferase CaiB-like acyl-CoA transferase
MNPELATPAGGMLAGVKVVGLTHFLQGPTCAQFLADLGADVVKVERPGGAHERHWRGKKWAASELEGDESLLFVLAGRNQRAIELDFSSEDGKQVLWRLIEGADVVVENFRAGVLDRQGFSYDAVRARNPSVIYCSLTGYGAAGPSSRRPGQDLLIQALSGLIDATGRDAAPTPTGAAIIDQHAGTLGALGILAALYRRAQTGMGAKVDSNLLSAALDLQIEPFAYHLNGAKLFPRSEAGVSTRYHHAPYGVFQTSDGWIAVSSRSDGTMLAKAFNDPELAHWTPQDQFNRRDELTKLVAQHLKNKSTAEWLPIMDTNGLWAAEVRNYKQVEQDPQLAANQSILEFDMPSAGHIRVLNHPIHYDGAPPSFRRPPPQIGQHTHEVLIEAGYSTKEIQHLAERGLLGKLGGHSSSLKEATQHD